MYDVNSKCPDDFINHEEILTTLAYAEENKHNEALIDSIIEKAKKRKGLSHREAAVLLDCDIEEKNQEIYKLAEQIKKDFYGNRIVMFAPLYLSNYCINGCTYCPYHMKNKHIARKKLTQEEIRREVIALQDMGHKRLALEAGEDPVHNTMDYYLDSINTIYSIKHKNGAIRRVNINIAATTASAPISFSRKLTIKKVIWSSTLPVRNMTTITTLPQWTEPWRAASTMWESAFFLDWTNTVMNLQDFLCMRNIWRLLSVSVLIPSASHAFVMQTISTPMPLITGLMTIPSPRL